jgi:hypothetical protein
MATYQDIGYLIDTNLASNTKIPAALHREVERALLDFINVNLSQSGDIKMIKCDITYLNENFETNGLGKLLRLGWAICNGNNTTWDFTGRVPLASGIGYSALGGLGGNKDAVVVSHVHSINLQQLNSNGDGGSGKLATGGQVAEGVIPNINTESTGVSGVDKNMQPYITTLFIMKL